MDNKEILMVILYIIELATIGIFYNLWKHEKEKRAKDKEYYLNLQREYCDKIEELNNNLKSTGRTIKVEKVMVQPRELECKFTMHDNFIKDLETFKKLLIGEVARYVAEELENDPHLYKLYFEKSVYNFSENIIAKLRLLPYPEEADWNLDGDQKEIDKVLGISPQIGIGWDKINRLGDYYKEEEE